jgi:hypothetical protein
MAWWRPEEEASPQSRVGAPPRDQAVTRPAEEAPHQVSQRPVSRPYDDPQSWVPPPRRFRLRIPAGLPVAIFALLFVAAFVVPIVLVFSSIGGENGIGGSGFRGPASHDGPSLVPRERFARALAKIRDRAGPEASVVVLRVEPKRVDAIMRGAGGRRTTIQVQPDLSVTAFPAGVAGQRGVRLSRIAPGLPERLTRRAAERLGASRDDLSYMAFTAIDSIGGGGVWSIFFSGRHVIADLDGSNMRVPGG